MTVIYKACRDGERGAQTPDLHLVATEEIGHDIGKKTYHAQACAILDALEASLPIGTIDAISRELGRRLAEWPNQTGERA